MSESEWDHWPIAGPRAVLWVLQFICRHYQMPDMRFTRFLSDTKLDINATGMFELQAIMRALYIAVTYDQIDAPQWAVMEVLVRRAQMIELKYKHKLIPSGSADTADPFQDTRLYMG